ncbi:MAG: FecR domain-containing protein [Bacteroidia bacterium]|nr:FecR domain-containing protein [Bacteroidia bacterium]
MENNRKLSEIVSDLEKGTLLPENEQGFQTIWDASSKFNYPEVDVEHSWQSLKHKIAAQPSEVALKVNYFRTWAIAASLALLVAFGALFYVNYFKVKPIEYVANNQNKVVQLPDGSTVTLNMFSSIITDSDFGKKHRNIELKGEGYFDVKKNAAIPFIVKTGTLETKVTGTQFDVDAYSNNLISVALNEGSVELQLNPKLVTKLKPGEVALVNKTKNEVFVSQFNKQHTLAWIDNQLVFENEPLVHVIKRLENVLNVKFVYPKNMDSVLITTTFTTLDPELISNILSNTLETEIRVIK